MRKRNKCPKCTQELRFREVHKCPKPAYKLSQKELYGRPINAWKWQVEIFEGSVGKNPPVYWRARAYSIFYNGRWFPRNMGIVVASRDLKKRAYARKDWGYFAKARGIEHWEFIG